MHTKNNYFLFVFFFFTPIYLFIIQFSSELLEPIINNILPTNCGKRSEDFNDDEDLIFAKVVHGSIAAKGTYPWQVSEII